MKCTHHMEYMDILFFQQQQRLHNMANMKKHGSALIRMEDKCTQYITKGYVPYIEHHMLQVTGTCIQAGELSIKSAGYMV